MPRAKTQEKEPEDTALATLVIRNAPAMTPEQRGEISAWLRAQGHSLKREGEAYPLVYTVKYTDE